MLQKLKIGVVDKVGGVVALLCAVHCLLLPFFLSFSSLFAHETVERFFLISAIAFTVFSLFQANKQGILELYTALFFIGGISCIVLSMMFHNHSVSAIGGVMLTIGHVYNWRLHMKAFHT